MFFQKNDPNDPNQNPLLTSETYPMLPLRDIVVYPQMVVPLFVGRPKSIKALEEAMKHEQELILTAQKNPRTIEPSKEDIYDIGTLSTILQLLRLPDGTVKVVVEGLQKVKIKRYLSNENYFLVEPKLLEDKTKSADELDALMRTIKKAFEDFIQLSTSSYEDILSDVSEIEEPLPLANQIAPHLESLKLEDRQAILESDNINDKLELILKHIHSETDILRVEKKIRNRVKDQMSRSQKEYYLNEQMQAIQKELGEKDEFKNELDELEKSIEAKNLPKEAKEKTEREIRKLKMMQPMSAEATVIRNYLDWIIDLPWDEKSEERNDLKEAIQILDDDHFGLEKPKARIIEHLAVQTLTQKQLGPVLCFVGPPGVGKTSLAKSIARATGREFIRLSLGGVRDEAEIRGHRRTYIGALPGRLLQSIRKCGKNNPVLLLDEIDKMSSDMRGDPASALLEVLDPEQNHAFGDHFLDLDYDLSDVMFITTANSLSGIPIPLRDRMEIIHISGYTDYEKLNIAKNYLLKRQKEAAGLKEVDVTINDDAIRCIMHRYTRESGVRNLEREIGSVYRKIARKTLENENGKNKTYQISEKEVQELLGPPRFKKEHISQKDLIGMTNGMAVTSTGGALLECEVAVVKGKGKLVITGLLEKGMQESAQAALSYIRSREALFNLEEDFHSKLDIHIHFPEFVPKDGPSAGVTMATSIASALMKVPVRRDLSMTGEITLRGRVMPIGGIKEKVLAAYRAGIKTILIPFENRKDLIDIPKPVLKELRIVLVEHVDEVLKEALLLDDPDQIFGKNRIPPIECQFGIWSDAEEKQIQNKDNKPIQNEDSILHSK